MNLNEIRVPEFGNFLNATVIELAVRSGDLVEAQSLVMTLETEERVIESRTPIAGVVENLNIRIGDKVTKDQLVLTIVSASVNDRGSGDPIHGSQTETLIPVAVPDIGDFLNIPVIDLCVKPGDKIKVDDTVVTLESDKATLDISSTVAGIVREVRVQLGSKVSEGSILALVQPEFSSHVTAASSQNSTNLSVQVSGATTNPVSPINDACHASPSVRRYARELGVDVAKVKGSGPKGRIIQQDVQAYVKSALAGATAANASTGAGVGLDLLPWPKVDFAKFGPIESRPLSRIKKISGANLLRNWVMIPHVTQFDEADITDLEAFRVAMNKENEKSAHWGGLKLTMLAFLIKASVAALKKFPDFNASIDGENLVMKQYFHIGFAADTPNGLVVPVLRDADRKGVFEIAREMGELAKKARDGKLGPAEMQGGCFSISSLGGIGGTAFTPIINAPEVAILGVSKTQTKPVWNGKEFVPRSMLPLSLSYDHRVIDGASAARFTSFLSQLLGDMRRTLL